MRILVHTCCGPCAIMPLSFLRDQKHEVVSFFYNPNIHPLKEYLLRKEGAKQGACELTIPFISADTLPFEEQQWHNPAERQQDNQQQGNQEGNQQKGNQQESNQQESNQQESNQHKPAPTAPASSQQESNPIKASITAPITLAPLPHLPPTLQIHTWLAAVSNDIENRCTFCWYSRLERTAAYAQKYAFDAFTTTLLYSRHQNHEKIRELAEQVAKMHHITFFYHDFRPMWHNGITRSKEMGMYRQQYCGCIFSEYDRYARMAQQTIAQ